LVLAALAVPAVADEVDELILDLKYGDDDVQNAAIEKLAGINDSRAVDPS